MNVCVVSERSAMQCNEGRLNEVGLQDTGAAVRNDAAKAKRHDSMERSETVRRTVGAAYACGCGFAAARTVSAGVSFCGCGIPNTI
jgi:hypothetical protein